MKTYMANPDKIERKWYVVDAEGCTLGRLSSEIAKVLRGKNKPEYTPHVDTGDYVIVVNADKVKVTGKKLQNLFLLRHGTNRSFSGCDQRCCCIGKCEHFSQLFFRQIFKIMLQNII